jgi:hypothetical protein
MAVEDLWIIREITDVVATATDSGQRRATGDQIPRHEQVLLQRRRVALLRAIAHRSPAAHGVQQAVSDAEARLSELVTETPAAHTVLTAIEQGGPAR